MPSDAAQLNRIIDHFPTNQKTSKDCAFQQSHVHIGLWRHRRCNQTMDAFTKSLNRLRPSGFLQWLLIRLILKILIPSDITAAKGNHIIERRFQPFMLLHFSTDGSLYFVMLDINYEIKIANKILSKFTNAFIQNWFKQWHQLMLYGRSAISNQSW